MAGPSAFQALMSAPPMQQPHPVAPRSNRPVPAPGQLLQTFIGGPGSVEPDAETAWGERYGPESEFYRKSLELSTNRANAERAGGRGITGEQREQREARRQQAKVKLEASRARALQITTEANALRNGVTTADTGNPPVPDPKYDAYLARANVLDEKLAYLLHDPTVVATQSADIKRLMEQKESLETELTALKGTSTDLRVQIERLAEQKEFLETEFTALKGTSTNLQAQLEQLSEQKESLETELIALKGTSTNLQAQLEQLSEEKKSLETELAASEGTSTNLQAQLERFVEEKHSLETEFTALKGTSTNLQAQLEQLTEKKISLETELAALKGTSTNLRVQLEQLQVDKIALEQMVERVTGESDDRIKTIEEERDGLESRLQGLEVENEALESELERRETSAEAQAQQLTMVQRELMAGKQRQTNLEQRLEGKRRRTQEAKDNVEQYLLKNRQEQHDKRQRITDEAAARIEAERLRSTEDMGKVREELDREREGWKVQHSDLTESLEKLKQQLQDANSALDEKRQRCVDLDVEKADMDRQITDLDRRLERMSVEYRATKLQLNNDKMDLTRELRAKKTEFDDTCQIHQAKVEADSLTMENQRAAYGTLSSSNLALEKTIAGLRSDLDTAISRRSSDWKDLEDLQAATAQARDLLTQQLQEKTLEYDQTKTDADRLQGRIQELDTANAALTMKLAERTAEHTQTLEDHRQVKKDKEVLAAEKGSLAAEKAALATEKETLAAENKTLVSEKAVLDTELETRTQALEREREAGLEEKRGLETRLNERKEALRYEKEAIEKILTQQMEENNKLRQETEKTKNEFTATQFLLTVEKEEARKLQAKHNTLSDTLSHREGRIDELKKGRAEMERHQQELGKELTACRADIEALKGEKRTLTADREVRRLRQIDDIEHAVRDKATTLKAEHSHDIARLKQHQSAANTALQGQFKAERSESDRKHRLELEKLQHDKDKKVKELTDQIRTRSHHLNGIQDLLSVPCAPPDDKGRSSYPITNVLTAVKQGQEALESTARYNAILWQAIGVVDPERETISFEEVAPLVSNAVAGKRELSEALSSAKAEVESLRKVRKTLGQVQAEKDSLKRERNSLRQEKDSLQQEKDCLRHEKDSLQQEKDSLQREFKQSQDKLADMSHLQAQLTATQELMQQLLQRQQTTMTGSPSLDDHHRTGGAETSQENAPESSSGGKRPVTHPITQPSKRPRLEDPGSPQAGPSTSGLAHVPNGDPPEGPGELPAAAVQPDYTFLKEVVNPFQSPNLPNSLWTRAQLPIGVTATVDAAMMAWSVKKSDWARPRKTSGNCVDSHLKGRRLLKLSDGESYACRRCVENKQPCVVIPKGSKPVVLPLRPDKRPPNATWQEIGYWVKG